VESADAGTTVLEVLPVIVAKMVSRFGENVAAILKRWPAVGALFQYLQTVRAGDRAAEFKQRCDGLTNPIKT